MCGTSTIFDGPFLLVRFGRQYYFVLRDGNDIVIFTVEREWGANASATIGPGLTLRSIFQIHHVPINAPERLVFGYLHALPGIVQFKNYSGVGGVVRRAFDFAQCKYLIFVTALAVLLILAVF